jgi:hypothetical protein
VFETGDEKLLKLTRETQSGFLTATPVVRHRRDRFTFLEPVPIVLVFTKYDRLVRTKKAELKEENDNLSKDELDRQSRLIADEEFKSHMNMRTVKAAMAGMNYIKVSSMISQFIFDQRSRLPSPAWLWYRHLKTRRFHW